MTDNVIKFPSINATPFGHGHEFFSENGTPTTLADWAKDVMHQVINSMHCQDQRYYTDVALALGLEALYQVYFRGDMTLGELMVFVAREEPHWVARTEVEFEAENDEA